MFTVFTVIYRFTCEFCDEAFLSETRDVQDSWGRTICLCCYTRTEDPDSDEPDLGAEADSRYAKYTATLLGVA